ncbi:MAG: magnesium/cobalt transporter CorA [Planctomycetaceae bacterium]
MIRKRHPPRGARPGTLVIPRDAVPPKIHVVRYEASLIEEFDVTDAAAVAGLLRPATTAWIDVQGIGDEAVLRGLADLFQVHPLALEDVVNVPQLPKLEEYDEHVLILASMARPDQPERTDLEQVSLFVGKGYVLTFQDTYGDVLDPVRIRLRLGAGPMRKSGPDYLAYALLDTMVDAYFPILETVGNRLEELEERVLGRPEPRCLAELNEIRRHLVRLRRAIWPQRDAVNRMVRDENEFLGESARLYLRDTHDHCVQCAEVVEGYREIAGGLFNTYLSAVSNRTNEIMKVLTIMSSIFIPLTFVAGIYGMNFVHMPELYARWAYPALLLLMSAIAIVMLLWFRRRGWLGTKPPEPPQDGA